MDESGEFVERDRPCFVRRDDVIRDTRWYLFRNRFRRPSDPITLYYLDSAGLDVFQYFRPTSLRKRPDGVVVLEGIIVRGRRRDMWFMLYMDRDANTAAIGYTYLSK